MKNNIITIAFIIFTMAFAASAQNFDKAKLDKFLDTLAEKNKAMGSLAVAKDGKMVYRRAVGYSHLDATQKTPATVETKYRIGSISKMFTAVMVFQLAEEGKLKLTDTLDKYYPQIPNAQKITLAQILGHRSGIHSFTGDADFKNWLMNPKTQREMLEVIAKSKPDFEPDTKVAYSNANYVLLGYIVEKVGKKPYGKALKDRITSKLGLTDTYLGGKTEIAGNESFSYYFTEDWKISPVTDLSIPGGAGAILSTPSDLVKFIQALFDLKLISQKSLDQMKTFRDGYGLGMFPYQVDGKTAYGHTGGIDAFNAMLIYLPEEKLAVAYTSNGMVYTIDKIVYGAADIYRNRPFTVPNFETLAVSPEVLEKYTGVYASEGFPLKITVKREGATLFAQASGQSAFPLEAIGQNKFQFEPAGIVLEFDAEKNQMTLKQRGRENVFTKEK